MPRPNYSPEVKRKGVEEHLKGGKCVATALNRCIPQAPPPYRAPQP